jgi:GNAT superfamily N-acetyltransferase
LDVWFYSPVIIRPARAADVSAAARVHHESSKAAYAEIASPDPNGLERRESAWRQVLDAGESSPHVCLIDREIVGVVDFGRARREPAVGELYIIYVLPPWWGSGVGQRLMDVAQEHLARTFTEAVLTVLAANPRARRFYERNGWSFDRVLVEPHLGQPTQVAMYRRRFE